MQAKGIGLRVAVLAAALSSGLSVAQEQALGEVTVTGTREGRAIAETPASVDVIKGEALRETRATHPSQVMGRVPGVWVNQTGGEGHVTAIRQPLTTSPVYLYLEDGIPVRSTGFFNHNALYEVNLPQAGGIEVSKGPGTALYGSDAIGGVVNVLTRTPPKGAEFEALGEAGPWGWKRLLASGGNRLGDGAFRADLNLTDSDGWRERTGYDRQSGTLRYDRGVGADGVIKFVAAFSTIDQQTAGSSAIVEADYRDNPTRNYTPISYRKVDAFRVSAAYDREDANSLLSITPYFRRDKMELLANWSLSYDPTVYTTENDSYGLMLKYRQDFVPMKARLIAGVDLDVSPGSRVEDRLGLTTVGAGATRVYTGYTIGARIYDYAVTYKGISPYLHGEISPLDPLRLTAGLRYDRIRYTYDNKLADAAILAGGKQYGHAADTTVSYGQSSPKLGATWAFNPGLNAFAAWTRAFRAPSEGQLFRPSSGATAALAQISAQSALGLKPVTAENRELGLRGRSGPVGWEVSAYDMVKRDDVVSYKDPATNASTVVNAGRTRHKGIEVGLQAELAAAWHVELALSRAKHTYEQWVIPGATDYSGKEMETAPRSIANSRLAWRPGLLGGGRIEFEWVHLGDYWVDQANTRKYAGHDVYNLRANAVVGRGFEVFASLMNLTDERYAESASLSSGTPVFAPGLPRALFLGVQAKW